MTKYYVHEKCGCCKQEHKREIGEMSYIIISSKNKDRWDEIKVSKE